MKRLRTMLYQLHWLKLAYLSMVFWRICTQRCFTACCFFRPFPRTHQLILSLHVDEHLDDGRTGSKVMLGRALMLTLITHGFELIFVHDELAEVPTKSLLLSVAAVVWLQT